MFKKVSRVRPKEEEGMSSLGQSKINVFMKEHERTYQLHQITLNSSEDYTMQK